MLILYASSLSPFVEATALGICTVQFTDNRNLSEKVSRIIQQLAESEITAQAAIAPTPDTSFLAANLARPLLQIENAKDFLVPLPIETLAIAGGGDWPHSRKAGAWSLISSSFFVSLFFPFALLRFLFPVNN